MNRAVQSTVSSLVAILLIMLVCVLEARAEKKIGVLLLSDEARYLDSKKGTEDVLKKAGFGEPTIVENAGGNKAKVMELAQKLAAAKMDVIITIGTNATVAATKATKDIPIIFSFVYDPVDAGIAQEWKSSGNNTTGVALKIPMPKLVSTLKSFKPVQRLGVLYTPGEKHTEVIIRELTKIEKDFQIKVVPVPITKKEDVSQLLPDIMRNVDALYLAGSSVYSSAIPDIVDTATKAKVVTITHVEEFVDKGVLLGLSSNPYQVGSLAGEKAVKVLKGAKPSSIPIETLKKLDVLVNMRTVQAGQFTVSQEFLKLVTRKVE